MKRILYVYLFFCSFTIFIHGMQPKPSVKKSSFTEKINKYDTTLSIINLHQAIATRLKNDLTKKTISINSLSDNIIDEYDSIIQKALQSQQQQQQILLQKSIEPTIISLLKKWQLFWNNLEKEDIEKKISGVGVHLVSTYNFKKTEDTEKAYHFNKRFLELTGSSLPEVKDLLEKKYKGTLNMEEEKNNIIAELGLINQKLKILRQEDIILENIENFNPEKITKSWKLLWDQIKKQDIRKIPGTIYGFTYEFKNERIANIAQALYRKYNDLSQKMASENSPKPESLLEKIYSEQTLTEKDIFSSETTKKMEQIAKEKTEAEQLITKKIPEETLNLLNKWKEFWENNIFSWNITKEVSLFGTTYKLKKTDDVENTNYFNEQFLKLTESTLPEISTLLEKKYNDTLDMEAERNNIIKELVHAKNILNTLKQENITSEKIKAFDGKKIRESWKLLWNQIQKEDVQRTFGTGPNYILKNKKIAEIAQNLYNQYDILPAEDAPGTLSKIDNLLQKIYSDKKLTESDLFSTQTIKQITKEEAEKKAKEEAEKKAKEEAEEKERKEAEEEVKQFKEAEARKATEQEKYKKTKKEIESLLDKWEVFWKKLSKESIEQIKTQSYWFGPLTTEYVFKDGKDKTTANNFNNQFLELSKSSLPEVTDLLEKKYNGTLNITQEKNNIIAELDRVDQILKILSENDITLDTIKAFNEQKIINSWKLLWNQIKKQDIKEIPGITYNSYKFKNKKIADIAQALYDKYIVLNPLDSFRSQQSLLKKLYDGKKLTTIDLLTSKAEKEFTKKAAAEKAAAEKAEREKKAAAEKVAAEFLEKITKDDFITKPNTDGTDPSHWIPITKIKDMSYHINLELNNISPEQAKQFTEKWNNKRQSIIKQLVKEHIAKKQETKI